MVLTVLAGMTIGFIALLFHIRDSLADERLEVIASLVLVVAAGGALVSTSVVEGAIALEFGKKHIREFFGYLLLSLVSLSSGLYLGISQQSTLQMVALVASLHAFIFGVAQLRMAQHLWHHPNYRRVFMFDGVTEIFLGLALVVGSRLSNEGTATLLGYVGIFSVLQVMPLLLHPRKAVSQVRRTGQL
jgi:uncharacterized membrane protein HdeD (DUF308 family)